MWALIVDDIRNPFFTDMVRGVEDIAYTEGYSLFLCNAEQDAVKEASYLNLALAERVAGVIVTPTTETLDVSALLDRGVAVVTADRKLRNHDVDSVVVDNVLGARQAVRHLLAGGYTRIGCITGPLDVTTGAERFAGYRLALQEADVQFDDSLFDGRFPRSWWPSGHARAAARPASTGRRFCWEQPHDGGSFVRPG